MLLRTASIMLCFADFVCNIKHVINLHDRQLCMLKKSVLRPILSHFEKNIRLGKSCHLQSVSIRETFFVYLIYVKM